MSEPNPYEPPPIAEPLKRSPAVKEWLDLGMILLLMPAATHVALFVSTSATWLMIYAMQIYGASPPSTAVISIVACGPPLATVVAMLCWAARVYWRDRRTKGRRDARPT